MKSLDDGLLTARVIGSSSVDGPDEGSPAAVAIHALYATGPQSPPIEGTGRAKRDSSPGANGTVQRLLMSLFLLVVAGCAVARWFHHDHGSYLPQWTRSGQGFPSIEIDSTDAEPIGKTFNGTAESTATTTATASPSSSPTFPSIENMDAGPTGRAVDELVESTATPSPSFSPTSSSTASAAASPLTEATASALDTAAQESAEPIGKVVNEMTQSTTTAGATIPPSASPTSSPVLDFDTGAHAEAEAVAALERQLDALEERTVDDESPRRKAALLEEMLSHHRRANDHVAAANVEQRLRGLGTAKFAVGDVVEQLYSAHTLKCRILYPFRVQELHFGKLEESSQEQSGGSLEEETRYTIVRFSDSMVVRGVPESFLRPYVPYSPETEALCNVGGSGFGEERLLSCHILEHILQNDERSAPLDRSAEPGVAPPPAPRVRTKRGGEEALESAYRVVVHDGGAEGEAVVPMGRVQRRP